MMSGTSETNKVSMMYMERFFVNGLSIIADVAEKQISFSLFNRMVTIRLPAIPDGLLNSNKAAPVTTETGEVGYPVLYGKRGNLIMARVRAVRVEIDGLSGDFSKSYLDAGAIRADLVTTERAEFLNNWSNHLYHFAFKAISYWIRVVRWVVDGPYVGITPPTKRQSDFGAIYNLQSGHQLRVPLEGRTLRVPSSKYINAEVLEKVNALCISGAEAPVWVEFLLSAKQRKEAADLPTCVIDIAIAIESAIRAAIDQNKQKWKISISDNKLQYSNISWIMGKWDEFELPSISPEHRSGIQQLFSVRNAIMHRGHCDLATPILTDQSIAIADHLVDLLHPRWRPSLPMWDMN